jgi:RNA polymerase sigma factor (sigma-70 family)
MISELTPEKLLKKFVVIRNKLNKHKDNKELKKQFDYYLDLCINKFKYMITTKTNRYRGFPNHQDLIQDGTVGLIYALRTYRPRKGNFYAWAHKYINTKISREANKHSTIKIPLHKAKDMCPIKVCNYPMGQEAGKDCIEMMENSENIEVIPEAIKELSSEQQEIIRMSYGFGGGRQRTIGNISKKMNISVNECERLRNDALNSLKNYFEV